MLLTAIRSSRHLTATMSLSIKEHNLPMLNTRNDWVDWINSIEDLAVRNDVWAYCNPEGIENLVFTVTKPPDSASRDVIQKYHSLQAIYDSDKKKYDKVSERIDITVCQEFKQHYLGRHTVRDKLIALADSDVYSFRNLVVLLLIAVIDS